MVVVVTFVLLTYLAVATPRKMSGWDFPRRQTETTGKTPILLTTPGTLTYQSFSGRGGKTGQKLGNFNKDYAK